MPSIGSFSNSVDLSATDNVSINVDSLGKLQVKPEGNIGLPLIQYALELIELQANATVTPTDHDSIISETTSDSGGYNNYINISNTTMGYRSSRYEAGFDGAIDTFERADSTTVGNSWSELTDVWSIDTNACQATYAASSSDVSVVKNIGTQATFDIKIKAKSYDTANGRFGFSINGDGSTAQNGLGARLANGTSYILTRNGVSLGSGSVTFSNDMWYWIRVQFDGTNIKGRAWEDGQAEPGTWDIETTTTDTGGDYVHMHVIPNASLTGDINFDRVVDVNDAATTKTLEFDLPTISGTVTDTQLVANYDSETGNSINYELTDGTNTDSTLSLDTKNTITNLTSNPTKLRVKFLQGSGNSDDLAWIKSVALKLWKS